MKGFGRTPAGKSEKICFLPGQRTGRAIQRALQKNAHHQNASLGRSHRGPPKKIRTQRRLSEAQPPLPSSTRPARSEAERAEGGTSGTLVTEILGAPQRETGKEELVKSLLAPRPKAHPRRGNPLSSLHRTPPRPSGSHREPAGTLSRRPPYSNFARTCKVAAKSAFSLTPGAARSLLGQDRKGPRRAPRGGERRRKGAGAVFAAGGNGAERTLRRRQWGAHPPWKRPPAGAESPAAAGRRPNRFPWSPRPSDFLPDQRRQEVDCPAGETSRSGMPGPAGSGTAPSAAPQNIC